MDKTTKPLVILAVCAATVLVAVPALAQDWTSLPELESGDHIAIQRGYDGPRYNDLRDCFEGANSLVDAEYFGTIVAVTDPDGSRSTDHDFAPDYATFAAQQWAEDEHLDPETDVVVVVGFQNRSIGVHVGERWKRLGMSDQTLEETVMASGFERSLRRHDFGDAMCSVLGAVDHRLAILQQEHHRHLDTAQEHFPGAEDRFTEVRDAVDDALLEDNEMHSMLMDRLSTAEELLDERDKIEERPHEVIPVAEHIIEISDDVEADLERYLDRVGPLDELEEQIEATADAIDTREDSDWSGPVAARQTLDVCRDKVAEARLSPDPNLLEIQDCLHGAEAELARSDERHYFLARAIPRGALIVFGLLVLGLVAARFLRRRRTLKVLRPDLEAWEEGLNQRGKNLDRLQAEFSWYFSDRSQFWQGDDRELDQTIADGINRAFLLFDEGNKLWNEANSLHDRSKLLGVGKLDRALQTLRTTPISLAGGAAEADRPLELPLTSEFETRAHALFNNWDAAYFEALRGLRRAAPVQERIAALEAEASELSGAAGAQVEDRERRGLPVDHLSAELASARQFWAGASELANERPNDAVSALEEAVEALQAVRDRARDGNQILDVIQNEVAPLRDEVQALLDDATRRGAEFNDSDFEPDVTCQNASQSLEQIIDLIASGSEGRAGELIDEITEELETTALRLAVCIEAPDQISAMVDDISSAQSEIKQPLFSIRMKLKRLDDDEVLAELSDHAAELGRLQQLNPRIDRIVKGITKAQSKGRTLRAVADLTAVVDVLESGADSLAVLQRYFENTDDDGPPAPPPTPLWRPPEEWSKNTLALWGDSEDAHHFRSLSLPQPQPTPS